MRILIFALLTGVTLYFTAQALAQSTLSIPAIEVKKSAGDEAATPTAAAPKKGIPLDGLWRSDSALIEAEKLSKEKKYAAALSILDRVLARNPRNSDAYVDQALAWLNLNQPERAKLAVENALLADRNHMGAYVVSGLVALIQKDMQQAEYFLSALRVVCKGENCPEFQTLQRILREAPPVDK